MSLPEKYEGFNGTCPTCGQEFLQERVRLLTQALQNWENYFYLFDDGEDFPSSIALDYSMESGVRKLLIEGRKVLKEMNNA